MVRFKHLFWLWIALTIFLTGCEDKSFKLHRSLTNSVRKFYDNITRRNLAKIYDYFPDEFKELYTREEFLALEKDIPKEQIMGAFALFPLRKYKIDLIRQLNKNLFEVTVIIYPYQSKPMKDIMKWKHHYTGWENISYKNLVLNLLKNYHTEQSKILSDIITLKKCKNQLQYLALALWEYCNNNTLTLNEFRKVPSNEWIGILQKNALFIDNKIPKCPINGIYTIRYDDKKHQFVFSCSKHPAITLPYKFAIFNKKGTQ